MSERRLLGLFAHPDDESRIVGGTLARYASIVPLAIASLLTVFATIILLLHMPAVSDVTGVATRTGSAHLGGLQGELLHAGGGLLVLLVTTVLSIYKPRGMTPYGWRKLHEQRTVFRS